MTPSSTTSTTRGRVSMVVDRGEGWSIAPPGPHTGAPTDSLPTAPPPPTPGDGTPAEGPASPPPPPADAAAADTFASLDPVESPTDADIEALDAALDPVAESALDLAPPLRPVVAVVGLAPRCGASTVARWVAAALAARDPEGAAIVSTVAPRGTGALRTAGAARLARGLAARSLEPVRAAGRLCLVDSEVHSPLSIAATYLAPLVLDVGHGVPAEAALSVADHVLLVAAPEVEPALAEVVAQSMAGSAPEPTVILDRALEDARWDARADVVLPESRLAARRAAAGREARGEIGLALTELAALLEASLWH